MASTTVNKLPGNYRIDAQSGYIYAISADDTTLESGDDIILLASTDQRTTAGRDIIQTAGDDYTLTASDSITQTATSGNITHTAGQNYTINVNNNGTINIENNYTTSVGGDDTKTVGGNQNLSVTGDQTEIISGDSTLTFENNQSVSISGNQTQTTDGTKTETVLGDVTETYGEDLTQSVSGNIEVTSGDTIRLVPTSLFQVDSPDSEFTGNVDIQGNTIIGSTSTDSVDFNAEVISDFIPKTTGIYDLGSSLKQWGDIHHNLQRNYSDKNVSNPYFRPYNPLDIYGVEDQRLWENYPTNTIPSSAYFYGGVGIKKDLNVGGFIYGRIETAVTSLNIVLTSTDVNNFFYPIFATSTGSQVLFLDNTSPFGSGGLRYNPGQGIVYSDRMKIWATDSSVSTTTGALTVSGGVGIAKDLVMGGDVRPEINNTRSIGNTTTEWASAYINEIYTKVLKSSTGSISIQPSNGITDIFGDIRVRGMNPIGTYPVVSNTLYVTTDGSDTNDGRALDAGRACRTIGGAINSPYYREGTQILVSPGHYLEDNPLRLKPYTSVRGSDIRTTFIEPINKTQDLFHLESGCYLNYMTFLNGRSGLLEGQYEDGFNRGAYATSFPPLEGDERIDLFHSPYVQNCTNQSGPWLKDGTMFVPNQTVQIPQAVGTGTWGFNTTSIVVKVGQGTIKQGMTINSGKQNPGFFNARTLLLANKPFLQEQVVAFVDKTFTTGTFSYNKIKCQRDVGLIVDSIALDLIQNSISDSVFAGLQYFTQSGYVDAIDNQITTTTAAINYVKTLVANTVTSAGGVDGARIAAEFNGRFDLITTILNTGTTGGNFQNWVTGLIRPYSSATTTATWINAFDALLLAKTSIQNQTINYINNSLGFTNFTTATCIRDVGYMIDSVAFDFKYNGNKQSIKSGVYYFEYINTSSNIYGEIPQTITAYDYIKSLINDIVLAKPLVVKYQTTVTQVTNLNSATIYEVNELKEKIDQITYIIRNGPDEAPAKTPINLARSQVTGVLNAYNLLIANRSFIQAEVIAYIDKTFGKFDYSREFCFRDVGILIENICYDMAFGGNQKSIESGLAYYDGVVSKIAGQEIQTVASIDYLRDLSQKIIVNTTVTNLLGISAKYSQVRNTVLTGGLIANDSIQDLFNIITTIISNGPSAQPVLYSSNGPDAAFVSAEILMQANREFIQQDTINWINKTFLSFPYSEIKCRRDTGLIIDSVAQDMLFTGYTQSTFAGLQYWNQQNYVGDVGNQLNPTVNGIKYLKETSAKIIQNITPLVDLVPRYQNTVTQVTNLTAASLTEVNIIDILFDIIIEIVNGNKTGWTDRIIPNGARTILPAIQNAFELLQANKNYLGHEVTSYIDATNFGFTYDREKCRRDVGYMIDAVCFDMLHSGNRQSIQAGLYYFGFTGGTSIHNQTTQTIAAFSYLKDISLKILTNTKLDYTYQSKITQTFTTQSGLSLYNSNSIINSFLTITNIISNGSSVASNAYNNPIGFTASNVSATLYGYNNLYANKQFMIEEVIAFIDRTYNSTSFNYDEAKCYRDVGLIVDAVSQDIVLGGNQKSIEAGISYWAKGYNYVAGQETTTTMAINYARDLALKVIANVTATIQSNTKISQVINPFFLYGGDYMPQEAVKRNFGIITKIITEGPIYAPPSYDGGGLFSLSGLNGSDVLTPSTVVEITTVTTGTYIIGLSQPTVGFGNNATLYFGDTLIFPLRDNEVEEQSLEFTGNSLTWNQRKIDQYGSMGGSLVDGAVISETSPIQSFVYDAFTQLTQGGRGIHIKRDGYAQLVSVFTIFSSIGVEVESGGIASIVNSNANFGNICLQAKGYGKRKFSGTIYNPNFLAWDSDNNVRVPDLDQYYPAGFWPNNAKVLVYCPELDDRPHISLVMEIVSPEGYINEQGFEGFLNASPTTDVLQTGTITLTGVSTENVYVGNKVFIRDQYARTTSTVRDSVTNEYLPYCASGTVVVDVGYDSIVLNKALPSGGGELGNTSFFDFFFCGNSYYTVLSSEISENPKPSGINILSTASTGGLFNQIPIHLKVLEHLNTLTNRVIGNTPVTSLQTSTTTFQVINPLIQGGPQATEFIGLRYKEMISIVGAANLTAAESVVPQRLRTKTGPEVQGAGAAISLIQSNINFMADEVLAFVKVNTPIGFTYDQIKCRRDVKIILQHLIYDIETGGRYNSVLVGLSYWSRDGAHHVVQLGENVTRTDLFPDGSTVNFYQRSYMSASGYVFEYVGAGIDYGSLPQRGVADPIQGKETVMLNSGKVFFTSTDQNGDFRIGPGLVISQATGVLSGRTFTKSLFANMTPFILAIEGGGLL